MVFVLAITHFAISRQGAQEKRKQVTFLKDIESRRRLQQVRCHFHLDPLTEML